MDRTIGMRGAMALVGALAGLSLYGLYEALEVLPPLAALALAAFASSLATALLGMWGPLPFRRAGAGAVLIAAVSAGLLVLAGMRFTDLEGLFDSSHASLAFFVTVLIPLPFWIAGSVRDYPALFAAAWGIVMRYVGAWLFVGLVWGLIYLSDALLNIVGIGWVERVIDTDAAPWIITGLALGLAIAVANELSEVVSPFIVLRLLRVLLPVVLAVMAVFLIALPFRGAADVFGSLSVAGTLLWMCVAAATLVTAAVERRDEDSVQGAMAWAARALAGILPVPAALAAWSVWLRVSEYGWTPPRLFAAVGAGMALAYGAAYLLAVVRPGWRAHLRQANIALALLLIAVAAIWQTPVLDAQRISSASQFDRIVAGRGEADPAAMVDWGRAGDRALDRLNELAAAPGQEELARRLRAAREVPRRATAADVAAVLPVRPETEAALRDRFLVGLDQWQLDSLRSGCATACVMVIGPFWPDEDAPQALIAYDPGHGQFAAFEGFALVDGKVQSRIASPVGTQDRGAAEVVGAILRDGLRFVPVAQNRLELPGGSVSIQR
ncbi:DUF4153 domain-containing protein [Cereibacter sp. SYSU M97828]|nr:DUF4153 domain-containing protein [Cereibacter flavus]